MKNALKKILAMLVYLGSHYAAGHFYVMGQAHQKKRQLSRVAEHAREEIKETVSQAFRDARPQSRGSHVPTRPVRDNPQA